jgi:hypothetical protein
MTNTAKALEWIVRILNEHGIPFQAAGGLAAQAYGSPRPLADIDLYISMTRFDEIRADVQAYITWGPARETGERWDLVYIKIEYEGQKIELSDSENTRIFDPQTGQWVAQIINYGPSEIHELYGIPIPVMPKAQLAAYKKILSREVDLFDLKYL